MSSDSAVIRLEKLTKSFDDGKTFAVRDVDLGLRPGELLVMLGTSGCGKTTTLKMINRLIEPTSGSIRIRGEDAASLARHELRRGIGYVFQGIGLFPHMTIGQNVAVVPRLFGWTRERIDRRVDELLSMVHLRPETFRGRYPRELSGGQQQRVGFARALAAGADILLLDEPFGALDLITRSALQVEFKELHKRLGFSAILVTHDMAAGILMADRIAMMRDGKILQVGTPHELMSQPVDDFVREMMTTPKRQADKLEAVARGEEAGGMKPC